VLQGITRLLRLSKLKTQGIWILPKILLPSESSDPLIFLISLLGGQWNSTGRLQSDRGFVLNIEKGATLSYRRISAGTGLVSRFQAKSFANNSIDKTNISGHILLNLVFIHVAGYLESSCHM
jgi:hypothetical protein